MGPPSVPHVNEDFFRVYFFGAHVGFAIFFLNQSIQRASWKRNQLMIDNRVHAACGSNVQLTGQVFWHRSSSTQIQVSVSMKMLEDPPAHAFNKNTANVWR
jgi:hypothetical protein